MDKTGNKKGAPLSPNLLNLKSNTMKNTMQSYGFFLLLAQFPQKKFRFGLNS